MDRTERVSCVYVHGISVDRGPQWCRLIHRKVLQSTKAPIADSSCFDWENMMPWQNSRLYDLLGDLAVLQRNDVVAALIGHVRSCLEHNVIIVAHSLGVPVTLRAIRMMQLAPLDKSIRLISMGSPVRGLVDLGMIENKFIEQPDLLDYWENIPTTIACNITNAWASSFASVRRATNPPPMASNSSNEENRTLFMS